MINHFSQTLFSIIRFHQAESFGWLLWQPAGLLLFILSDAFAHDFAIDMDFHPDGLVMCRSFVLGDNIGDIHISVLLYHFLQVRLVVMVIVSLINKIEEFFMCPKMKRDATS